MVNNMKSRQMSELLSGKEKERVKEIHKFWKEIPPGHVGRQEAILCVTVINRLTKPIVFSAEPELCCFQPDPDAEECLEEVVEDDHSLDVEGFPVLHVPRSPDSDDVIIQSTKADGREGGWHQEPVIHSGIPEIIEDVIIIIFNVF